MPARTRRSMMRRMWMLPLKVVADCGITAFEGGNARSP
jgi:hypothetical protein